MDKISSVNRTFIFLGKKIGETQRLIINNLGVAFVSPMGMLLSTKLMYNESPAQQERHKTEIKYQALRSPISAVTGFLGTYLVYWPVIRKMNTLALEGKLSPYMTSLITLDTDKFPNVENIYKALGPQKVSKSFQEQVSLIHQLSSQLVTFEKSRQIIPEEQKLRLDINDRLRTIWTSNTIDEDMRKSLRKFFKIFEKEEFKAYKQVKQTLLYLIVTPFTMTLLNYMFPPFVKYFFPSVDKAVRDIH